MIIKKLIFCILLTAATIPVLSAEESAENDRFAENLEVSLAIIGPADALYSWWGHVAIIIENTENGAARYYDYGNFSFDQDSFVQNFVMGRLYFLKMASNPDRQLKYNAYLNRDVTVYQLNVSPEDKLALLQFLENDILPENRIYLYDHFYDNCATRIRDLMDIITGDEFSRTYKIVSDKTLRMQLRRFTYSRPFMDWLLNFAMKGSIDQPATEYDGMFLPLELERGVSSMMITDKSGERIPFVKDIEVINRAEGRTVTADYPPPRWPFGLAVGIVLGAAAWFLKRKGLAVYSMLLSFILAVPGTLLFFMACFTDHSFTYWNTNLLFVNPFLFITFAFSIRLLINKEIPLRTVQLCWTITGAGVVLSIILKLIPFFRQANWETIIIVLLPSVVMSSLIPRLRKHIKQQKNVIT
ncbi:MAG TPA: hypothetical protein DCO79_13225 [Spirochaeta sp.]|nr:hypothetical protein [Spirochaeta sp.]